MDDMTKIIGAAVAAGLVPSVGGFIAMKVEHAAFKQTLKEHDRRLEANEDTIARIDQNTQKTALHVAQIKGALNIKDGHG